MSNSNKRIFGMVIAAVIVAGIIMAKFLTGNMLFQILKDFLSLG